MLAAIIYAGRIHWPTREDAIRRIESISGVPHRPASSYEDTLSSATPDPATMALWKAHRSRMAELLGRLKSGKPRPRTDRYDPFALRALLLLFVVTLGGSARRRRVRSHQVRVPLRLWDRARMRASMPGFLRRPTRAVRPLMLADGAAAITGASTAAAQSDGKPPEVPERSVLIIRSSGTGIERLRRRGRPAKRREPQAHPGRREEGAGRCI